MATRKSWMESGSVWRSARFNWKARRRSSVAVWSRAKSRMLIARPNHRDRPVVDLAEGLAGALGAPLLQADVVAAVHLEEHFAIAHAAFDAGDALLAAAIEVVGQPQNRGH